MLSGPEGAIEAARLRLRDVVEILRASLDGAILNITLDVYEPDRDEVLLGLLSRQFRLFASLAHDPHLWTPELGNAIGRMLTDGLILAAWLARRNDPTLFRRYKDYSLGKQKLLKLHLETAADERRADAEEMIEALQNSLDEEMWEELIPIDVGAMFDKMDTRKMAQEVGLNELYTFGFAPLSADIHGEWTNLKSFYLQRCVNPLHHFHQVPRLQPALMLSPAVVVNAAALLIEMVHALRADYSTHLATPKVDTFIATVEQAFIVGDTDGSESDLGEEPPGSFESRGVSA